MSRAPPAALATWLVIHAGALRACYRAHARKRATQGSTWVAHWRRMHAAADGGMRHGMRTERQGRTGHWQQRKDAGPLQLEPRQGGGKIWGWGQGITELC